MSATLASNGKGRIVVRGVDGPWPDRRTMIREGKVVQVGAQSLA